MPTHVALLRGINLGGRNKVAMADLRAIVGELGHTDVSTYIQSGNVLFHAVVLSEPPWPELTGKLDAAMAQSAAKGARDEVAAIGRTLYLHTPDGYGNSDLAAALLRIVSSPRAGATGTARNWATVTKLLTLCDA